MINFDHVTFTYEGQSSPSLTDVSLQVPRGACVLVSGPSGCGKSTLLRLVNGLIPHFYEGTLEGNVQVEGTAPGDAPLYDQASRTGSVFQNPRTQFYTTDTTSEIAFALENQGIPAPQIIGRVEQVACDMKLAPLMDRSLFALSGGEKQKIACACVNAAQPDVIVLDEPTANLDYDASLALAQLISEWKRDGKTVLIAEHRIAWVLDQVTQLVIMNDGRIADVLDAASLAGVDAGRCRAHGLRTPVLISPDAVDIPRFDPEASRHEAWSVDDLHFGYDKGKTVLDFDRIDLAKGAITAVVGRNGRGKTTFLRCLTGLERKDRSIVHFDGQAWDRKARLDNVFLVRQDVNCQLFTQSVAEEVEISLPPAETASMSDEERTDRINSILSSLDLADLAQRDPFTLSGGQKQRVAVACAVASGRPMIAFDEPTSGLGLDHMLRFADLLRRLVEQGRTVIVVTHDAELIQTAADYLLVL
ncbi:ABC transporter ATP-binding protein [Slackia heliotrinireducens]|uniref:ABC transporter ATP-binding protein n=1 Tax=Slackia heliotrinireducens TaxID=84110 RepID=UPI003314B4D6